LLGSREMTSVHRSRSDVIIDVGFWALTAACVAATLWFSFVAPPPGADLFTGADKVGHAVAYFATTLSFLFAAVWRPGRGFGRSAHLGLWFAVAAIAGGAVIEIFQGMTATRSAQGYDLVAEAIGTGAALAVHSLIRRHVTRRRARAEPRRVIHAADSFRDDRQGR
jgi:VanZ family protein